MDAYKSVSRETIMSFIIIGANNNTITVQVGDEHEILRASLKQMLDGYRRYRSGVDLLDAFSFLDVNELNFLVTGNPFSVQVDL